MVNTMHQYPATRRILETTNTQGGERILKPLGALETSMREQAMVSSTNPHGGEQKISYEQPRYAPPTEKVGEECKWNCQVHHNDGNDVLP